jgi:hypothetical protein
MIPRLESAEYVRDYTIHVRFADGVEGDVDLADELWGEVFEPLKDLDVFRSFHFDKEINTVTWPSGADFAPEFLYERAAAPRPIQ